MGLKFQREDSLDKMFEAFAVLPEEKEKREDKRQQDIERFLNPKPKESKKEKNQ
ncbi:SPJ_0845 family protein [Enterococcus sp. LJL98]